MKGRPAFDDNTTRLAQDAQIHSQKVLVRSGNHNATSPDYSICCASTIDGERRKSVCCLTRHDRRSAGGTISVRHGDHMSKLWPDASAFLRTWTAGIHIRTG